MSTMLNSIFCKVLIGIFGLLCFVAAFYALGTLDSATRVLCIMGIIGMAAAKTGSVTE